VGEKLKVNNPESCRKWGRAANCQGLWLQGDARGIGPEQKESGKGRNNELSGPYCVDFQRDSEGEKRRDNQ